MRRATIRSRPPARRQNWARGHCPVPRLGSPTDGVAALRIESGRMPQKEARMFKNNANGRRIAATLLAIALSACGSIQGASPVRAEVPSNALTGDLRLTEFDPNDTVGSTTGEAGLLGGEYPPAPSSLTLDQHAGQTKVAPALVP